MAILVLMQITVHQIIVMSVLYVAKNNYVFKGVMRPGIVMAMNQGLMNVVSVVALAFQMASVTVKAM